MACSNDAGWWDEGKRTRVVARKGLARHGLGRIVGMELICLGEGAEKTEN